MRTVEEIKKTYINEPEAFPDEDQSKLEEHVKLLMLSKLLHP